MHFHDTSPMEVDFSPRRSCLNWAYAAGGLAGAHIPSDEKNAIADALPKRPMLYRRAPWKRARTRRSASPRPRA